MRMLALIGVSQRVLTAMILYDFFLMLLVFFAPAPLALSGSAWPEHTHALTLPAAGCEPPRAFTGGRVQHKQNRDQHTLGSSWEVILKNPANFFQWDSDHRIDLANSTHHVNTSHIINTDTGLSSRHIYGVPPTRHILPMDSQLPTAGSRTRLAHRSSHLADLGNLLCRPLSEYHHCSPFDPAFTIAPVFYLMVYLPCTGTS